MGPPSLCQCLSCWIAQLTAGASPACWRQCCLLSLLVLAWLVLPACHLLCLISFASSIPCHAGWESRPDTGQWVEAVNAAAGELQGQVALPFMQGLENSKDISTSADKPEILTVPHLPLYDYSPMCTWPWCGYTSMCTWPWCGYTSMYNCPGVVTLPYTIALVWLHFAVQVPRLSPLALHRFCPCK